MIPALCKPLRCLSFLGGGKREAEYSSEEQRIGRGDDEEDDEDDFFGDFDEPGGNSKPSKSTESTEATSQGGLERHPSGQTTKRGGGGAPSSTSAPAPAPPQPKAAAKKAQDHDFFADLGMEPEYQAPRILEKKSNEPKGERKSTLMDEDEGGDATWGEDALDLKL